MSESAWKILFADDDPTAGLLMKVALGGEQFKLTVVDNGSDALARLKESTFDLALLDVEMPGLDGLQVCSAIRQEFGDAFPVMLVTGRTDQAFVDQARQLSAHHLAKPLDWTMLAGRIRTFLEGLPR